MTSAIRSRSKSALLGRILTCLLAFGLLASAVFAEDLAETRKKAEQGDAAAQFNLGLMYADGDGVPKDAVEAVKWYRKAAEQGNADAQFNLGLMYDNGKRVPKDAVEAVKWYRKAAEQGNANAQYNLGNMYNRGEGVPRDLVQAHMWWNIAGAKGDEDAKKILAIIEKQMTDSQKEKATDLARELFARLEKK